MDSREGLSVYGYIRENFEQKCLILEIIRTIFEFFRNKGGFLYVCGHSDYGCLGIDEFYDTHCKKPTCVQSVTEIVDVAAFCNHTMLVDYNHNVWAFGRGEQGQLGTGKTENVKVPKQISLQYRAIAVSIGHQHSLILVEGGDVLSCGDNTYAQLGHDSTQKQSVPKVIEALKGNKIIQISSGSFHNGALSEEGEVFMWGYHQFGQCGVGSEKGTRIYTPQMINLDEKVNVMDCGHYHSLLITMNNLLYSFGCGDNAHLGHGTEEDVEVPTMVETFRNVKITKVAGGREHTLCIDDECNVWAFGRNHDGECGQSEEVRQQTIPKEIEYFTTNMIKVKEVEAGAHSSCVISQNNECFVFGQNESWQLGLEEQKSYFMPIKLPLSVQKVLMGRYHSTFISDYKHE